jgi:hypothetical protein
VEVEVLAHAVLDELDGLEVAAGHVEALELEGAVFYAADDGVAGDVGGLRGADFGVVGLGACYAGVGECVFTWGALDRAEGIVDRGTYVIAWR